MLLILKSGIEIILLMYWFNAVRFLSALTPNGNLWIWIFNKLIFWTHSLFCDPSTEFSVSFESLFSNFFEVADFNNQKICLQPILVKIEVVKIVPMIPFLPAHIQVKIKSQSTYDILYNMNGYCTLLKYWQVLLYLLYPLALLTWTYIFAGILLDVTLIKLWQAAIFDYSTFKPLNTINDIL